MKMTKPSYIRKTAVERAILGYENEIRANPPAYCNLPYVQNLIHQEELNLKTYNKNFGALIFLNVLSLCYIQSIKFKFSIFGLNINEIPASSQILCFLLGLNLFGFSIGSLDVLLYARMRSSVVFLTTGSDSVSFSTAHLKGGGLWVDTLTQRFVGFSSSKSQIVFSRIVFSVMSFFISLLFIASGASLISLYKHGLGNNGASFDWPTIISTSGLIMGILGIIIFFTVQLIPFKYSLPVASKKGNVLTENLENTQE
jgi:hypothetical protein